MSRLAAVLIRAALRDRQALGQLSAPLLRKLNNLRPPFPWVVATTCSAVPPPPKREAVADVVAVAGCRRGRRLPSPAAACIRVLESITVGKCMADFPLHL